MRTRLLASTALALLMGLSGAATAAPVGQSFGTHLTGDEEVPANESRAQGQATFHLSEDGESLDYKLIVSNIENVVQAHIHVGPAGENGPVVAFLFGPAAPGGGRSNGVLAEGTITDDDLVGPLMDGDMDDLIAAMRAGNTYANVHTSDGDDQTSNSPGDFPGGEIRGQIEARGPGE